jgi:sugar O-acyltransferase (sialic acid O-acetyltransferase NeuD family)
MLQKRSPLDLTSVQAYYSFLDHHKLVRIGFNMSKLAIFGAGGHSKVVADTALCSGWQILSFFEDGYPNPNQQRVIGDYSDLIRTALIFNAVIVAIGNNAVRAKIASQLSAINIPLATLIHPAATISSSAKIGAGSVVFAGAVINADSVIGDNCIINTHATIEHDCVLATDVHVSPGVTLGGGVRIGKLSWIGIGATVRHGITIGEGVIVAAGAVVVKDIPDNCLVAGVPATIRTMTIS